MRYPHDLVVAGSLVFLVSGDYDLVTRVDREIFVIHGVSCSDLRSFL